MRLYALYRVAVYVHKVFKNVNGVEKFYVNDGAALVRPYRGGDYMRFYCGGRGKSAGMIIAVEQSKNSLFAAFEDDAQMGTVEGKGELHGIGKVGVDGLAEELRDGVGFLQRCGRIEHGTHFALALSFIQKKIVDQRISAGPDGGGDGGAQDKGVELIGGEMPYSVDQFALEEALLYVIADGAVGQAGHERDVVDGIVFIHDASLLEV